LNTSLTLYIYYFSGTGNAELSSKWIAEEFVRSGYKAHIQRIDKNPQLFFPEPDSSNLIGFAFPTHGFNAAPIMLKFLAGFPAGTAKNVFFLNTRAGMKLSRKFLPGLSGVALIVPAIIMLLKGYRIFALRSIDMPSNWIPLHPGLRTKVVTSIVERCERIIRKFAGKLLSGQKTYRGLYSLPVDLAISPIAAGYYIGGRFFLSKTFIANSRCTRCGLCVKECPTSSIIMVNDRPYWKLTCESCMRCLNHCPEKAIETPHGLAAVLILLLGAINSWVAISLVSILNINTGAWWWKISSQFIYIGIMILVATIIYFPVHYAIGWKPANQLLRFTSLTTLPFWRRYDIRKLKLLKRKK